MSCSTIQRILPASPTATRANGIWTRRPIRKTGTSSDGAVAVAPWADSSTRVSTANPSTGTKPKSQSDLPDLPAQRLPSAAPVAIAAARVRQSATEVGR